MKMYALKMLLCNECLEEYGTCSCNTLLSRQAPVEIHEELGLDTYD